MSMGMCVDELRPDSDRQRTKVVRGVRRSTLWLYRAPWSGRPALVGHAAARAAGPRGWWPGDGRDEIIIGAVLTQNTAWRNVEKALENLKAAKLCRLSSLARRRAETIARLIVPSGYFNLKARRLKSVARFFAPGGRERFDEFAPWPTEKLREALLGVWGVGPETADSILLYALGRPSFVIDAYTMRVAP